MHLHVHLRTVFSFRHTVFCYPRRQFSNFSINADLKPIEIKLKKQEKALYIKFNNDCSFRYPAEFLRVESPSAEVQGHGTTQGKRIIAGRKYVGIIGIEPVGNYAIRLIFDDLHESGIYSWSYLYEIGTNKYQLMKKYIKALKALGKSRDPRSNKLKQSK